MHLLSNFYLGAEVGQSLLFNFMSTQNYQQLQSSFNSAKEALTQASLKQEGLITLRKPSVNFTMHLYSSLALVCLAQAPDAIMLTYALM